MSLARIAARIAAIQALMGRTLVGNNVLDSQIGALDIDADGNLRTEEDRPFISVYSDAAKAEGPETQARSLVENGDTEFVFEAGITAAHMELNQETGERVLIGVGIPATDAALEFHLDIVCRQISDTLADPENEWSEIFRKLVRNVVRVDRVRTSGAENGIRLAGHQIRVTAQMIADPIAGTTLKETHALSRFFAKAATIDDEVMQAQIAVMHAQLTGDLTDLDPGVLAILQWEMTGDGHQHPWQTALRRYGLTRSEGDSLLVTPPEGAEDDVAIGEVVVSPAIPGAGE